MSDLAIRQSSARQRWPMTSEAWATLVGELGRLRADLATLAGASPLHVGVAHFPVAKAARRLAMLTAVFDAADQVHDADRAVIGRRVTLLEQEEDSVNYELVFPGDGDPAQGWISAGSPLGTAILGCTPGDTVEVIAPAGRRVVTLLAVE